MSDNDTESIFRVPYDPDNPDVIIETDFGTLRVRNYPIRPYPKDPREDENYQPPAGASKDYGVRWDSKDLKVRAELNGRLNHLYCKTIQIIEEEWDQNIADKNYAALESFSTRDLGLVLVSKILPIYYKFRKSPYSDRLKTKEDWIQHVMSSLKQACDTVRATVPSNSAIWHRLSSVSPNDNTVIPSIHARTGAGGPLPPLPSSGLSFLPPEPQPGFTAWQHALDVMLTSYDEKSDIDWSAILRESTRELIKRRKENLVRAQKERSLRKTDTTADKGKRRALR